MVNTTARWWAGVESMAYQHSSSGHPTANNLRSDRLGLKKEGDEMTLRNTTSLIVLSITLAAVTCFGQMTVVNGASYDSSGPMAPGSFVTVFGQNLCPQTAVGQLDGSGQYPTSLSGCSVMVNGVAAMMQFASPGQMNFLVPQNMGPGTASLIVNNGAQVMNGSMTIGPAGPGVFALNAMGMGNGAMLHGTMWQTGPFSTMTNGAATPVSIFLTGMDLSAKPVVSIGGIPVDVMFYGNAPGYPGLQQINIMLPANMAGVGRVPVTVTSNGQTSNVTFMEILPTTAMMQGMPGWGSGMMVGDNQHRGREMSFVAVNPVNNTALVTDEEGDALRVISLDSKATVATISLPDGSQAHAVAVDATGKLAAVALTAKGSVALIDLVQNKVTAVAGSGYYASRLAFSGTNLLVTNSASGTVAVFDTNTAQVAKTVTVGFGPSGIAVAGTAAVVANMQGGTLSLINLNDYSVNTISLPAGARPHEVAISASANKAVVSDPMWSRVFILDLTNRQVSPVDLGVFSAMGAGSIAANGSLAYVANQMTSSVSVVDLGTGAVARTFPVDPGPRSLAVNALKNQLLVLSQGTGTLALVDLSSYAIAARINAGDGDRSGNWTLPAITSVAPNTAKAGDSFTLTLTGSNLQSVTDVEFRLMGAGMGGGMMGGGDDPTIKVTNVRVDSAGTQITASVQVLATAAAGSRQIRLVTDQTSYMAQMGGSVTFTVTR